MIPGKSLHSTRLKMIILKLQARSIESAARQHTEPRYSGIFSQKVRKRQLPDATKFRRMPTYYSFSA
jgi:hypothetical protein